jgi:CheY-like chemotaxis protein
VVDDNRAIREFCRDEFEEDGYRVLLAGDGLEACQQVRREQPDLVILDISMPEMDGLAVIEQLRFLAPEMPVVFFTSYDDACTLDARGPLATACVEKSEDLSELKHVVGTALAARRLGQPYRLGLPPVLEAV